MEKALPKLREVHGNRYEYLEVFMVGGSSSVRYMCREHGERVSQVGVMLTGGGCLLCGYKESGRKRMFDFSDYTARAEKVHKQSYAYVGLDYSSGDPRISYVCDKHGMQRQRARNHLQGQGVFLLHQSHLQDQYRNSRIPS